MGVAADLPRQRVLSAEGTNPDGHTQEKLPTRFTHRPPSHVRGVVVHSSTSGQTQIHGRRVSDGFAFNAIKHSRRQNIFLLHRY